MTISRVSYILVFSIVVIVLAACGSAPADQAAEPRLVEAEAATPAHTPPADAVDEAPQAESADDITEEQAGAVEDQTETQSVEAGDSNGNDQTTASPDDEMSHLTEDGLVASAPTGTSLQPQLALANIDMDQVVTLLPPDAIRAVNPEEVSELMVTVEEAIEVGIKPDVRVMGVSINGESHAYPIPFLSRHEIINAEVGGKLIAATW